MGSLIIIIVLAVLGWLSSVAVRSWKRRGVGLMWWVALVGCLVVGFALGVWFAFVFKYQPEPTLRVIGFPLPSAIFTQKMNADGLEYWKDYPNGLGAILDVLLFCFLAVSLVWLANTLWRFMSERNPRRRGQS